MGKHKVIICLFTVNLLIWDLESKKGGQQKNDLHLDLIFFSSGYKKVGNEEHFLINNFGKTMTYITDHSQICLHKQNICATGCQVMLSWKLGDFWLHSVV